MLRRLGHHVKQVGVVRGEPRLLAEEVGAEVERREPPAVGALVVAVEELGDGVEAERRHAAVLLHGAAQRHQGRLGGGIARFGGGPCYPLGRRRGSGGGRGGRGAVAEAEEGHDDALHLAGGVGAEPVDEVPPRLQFGVGQRLLVDTVVGLKFQFGLAPLLEIKYNSKRCTV